MMRRYVIMILLAAVPGWAAALGLGNIELNSALNQPLDARIKLLSPTRSEIQSLKVELADNDAFERAGIDRPFILSHLRFEIVTNEHGPDYVHITTKDPIREPFLNFLVEADWSNGRLYREYTVLLDPPLYNPDARQIVPTQQRAPAMSGMQRQQQQPPAPAPTPAPPQAEGEKVSPAPMGGGEAAPAKPAKPAESAKPARVAPPAPVAAPAPAPAAAYSGGDYGPTVTGNTLWSIAKEVRPDDSISIQQMMLALLRANPEAFIHNNIDGLKRGYVLHMPSREEITSLNKQDALSQVKSQYAIWDEVKGKMAAEAGQRPAGGTATPGETAPAPAAKSESELKIVTPEKGKGAGQAGGGGQKTGKDLALANEQLQSLTAENSDLKQQASQSDAIIGDLKRLINLKDNEVAALQQQLTKMQAKQAAAAAAAAKKKAAEAAAKKKAAQLAAAKSKPASKAQPPAPGMLDQIKSVVMANLTALGGVFAALILAIAGLVMIRRRAAGTGGEEVVSDELPPELGTEEGAELPSGTGDETDISLAIGAGEEDEEGEGEVIGESNDDFTAFAPAPEVEEEEEQEQEVGAATVTEFPDAGEPMAAEAAPSPEEEEDPLSEVNVFLAYEHFDQAEEFVRDAISHDPDNLDFHSKLLEVFYAAGNKTKYEKEAEVLHDLVNGEGPHWEMAQVMWQELSPNRPLFAEPTEGEGEEAVEETTGVGMVDLTAPEEEEEAGLDFDLGVTGTEEQPAAAEDEEEILDLTTPSGEDESPLDYTLPSVEDEDILDVTAAVGLDTETEEEETLAGEEDNDVLDITGGEGTHSGDTVDMHAGVENVRSGDTVKMQAGGGEDLLDVTAHADLETDSIDEDLLDVTAATSDGADSEELLEIGTGEESKEAEAGVEVEEGSAEDNSLDFDIGGLGGGGEELETGGDENRLDTLDLGVDGLEFEQEAPGEEDAGNVIDLEGSGDDDENEGGLTLEPEEDKDAGETESGLDLEGTFRIEKKRAEESGELSLDTWEEAGTEEDQGAELDLTMDNESFAEKKAGGEAGEASGGLSLELEKEEDQAGAGESDEGGGPTVFVPRSTESEGQSAEDEVATKLDLAKAYVELGDKDSAKNILEEIINDGSEEQRRQAQDLLSQVS